MTYRVFLRYRTSVHHPSANIPTSELILVPKDSLMLKLLPCLSRHIASFFLGWVFIGSLLCIMTSPVMRQLYRRCFRISDLGQFMHPHTNENGAPWNNNEKPIGMFLSDDQVSRITSSEDSHRDLILMLSICFAFASIAHFSSLLSFQSGSGSSACGESHELQGGNS